MPLLNAKWIGCLHLEADGVKPRIKVSPSHTDWGKLVFILPLQGLKPVTYTNPPIQLHGGKAIGNFTAESPGNIQIGANSQLIVEYPFITTTQSDYKTVHIDLLPNPIVKLRIGAVTQFQERRHKKAGRLIVIYKIKVVGNQITGGIKIPVL